MSYPPSINKLIEIFSQFPGVGPRTAQRFVFYILKKKNEEIKELLSAIVELKRKTKFCSFCFNPFEPKKISQVKCEICSDPLRDKSLLCILATETDLNTIEKTKKYKGLYFVLGGLISNFDKKKL